MLIMLNNENNDDDTAANPFKFYSQNIGQLIPAVSQSIMHYQDDLPDELITEAMKIAVNNNVRKWKYIKKILDNWIKDGIKTTDDYRRHEAERSGQKQDDDRIKLIT